MYYNSAETKIDLLDGDLDFVGNFKIHAPQERSRLYWATVKKDLWDSNKIPNESLEVT
jgi:hypothetical protein